MCLTTDQRLVFNQHHLALALKAKRKRQVLAEHQKKTLHGWLGFGLLYAPPCQTHFEEKFVISWLWDNFFASPLSRLRNLVVNNSSAAFLTHNKNEFGKKKYTSREKNLLRRGIIYAEAFYFQVRKCCGYIRTPLLSS